MEIALFIALFIYQAGFFFAFGSWRADLIELLESLSLVNYITLITAAFFWPVTVITYLASKK